jgi:hypothetical protein
VLQAERTVKIVTKAMGDKVFKHDFKEVGLIIVAQGSKNFHKFIRN